MTALQVLKELKKEKWPKLKTGEYNLPLILAAMHKFAELRQCNVSGALPLTDAEKLAIAWKTLEWIGFSKWVEFEDKDILEMLGGNDR